MNKKYIADIKYSKQLIDEFPDAEWWWVSKDLGETWEIGRYLKGAVNLPAIHTDMIIQILPKKIDNKHGDLSIVMDSINPTVWIGYDGKELKDEISASAKKLVDAGCKLFLWIKKEAKNG